MYGAKVDLHRRAESYLPRNPNSVMRRVKRFTKERFPWAEKRREPARIEQSGLFPACLLRRPLFQRGLLGEDCVALIVEILDHDLRFKVDLVIVLRVADVLEDFL